MKVLFYIHGLSGGGAEKVLSLLANHFSDKLNYQVSVLTYDPKDQDFYKLSNNIKRIHIKKTSGKNIFSKIFSRLKYLFKLRNTVNTLQPDIILPLIVYTNIEMLIATMGLKIPVIVAEHSNYFSVNSSFFKFLRIITYKFASKVILLTYEDKKTYDKYLTNTQVIENPITLNCNQPNIQKEKYILCVGRLNPLKQFDHVILAFSKIQLKYPEWKLIIAGDGSEKENLQSYINNLNMTKSIELIGSVKNIALLYQRSEIFVLSSRYEGLPMSLGEAMLCSLAVLSYDCPTGPKDMIEHEISGILIEHNNKKHLEKSLESLIKNSSLRKNLGYNAHKKMQNFSIDKIAFKWTQLLNEILLKK